MEERGSAPLGRLIEPLVSLRGVAKRFGERRAVDGVDLDVPAGACFGLLGPNGAGKTTTLRMVYGVTRPTAGRVHVFGLDVAREPRQVRSRLGVTLQENALIESLSPEDNLRVFGRFHLLRGAELERRVGELVDFLDLRSHAKVPVRHLSGGFQRRLAIALSLMNRPELLILDEPTTGLDPAIRQAVWARVRELRATGTTVLLTTHYMDEAERLCDDVAIFANGRIESQGAPRTLIARHLAAEALELDCGAIDEEKLFGEGGGSIRRMRAGNRLIVYASDVAPLLERVHRFDESGGCRAVVRPTNLEDVFLLLTGTRIGEADA
ncbi:MAG: ABC transporter ATP-binding protein [Deltaproteobacteria bacterium]|nr:ABC transporter ATP-binding protein [Deltaproteobacteria bacterium]